MTTRWIAIAGTPARYRVETLMHDGVAVLWVRLDGHADNSPDGVGLVRDELDDMARGHDAEVATLDVSRFANATDDACSILTGVLAGVPCCWITHDWEQQRDGQRWDLPPPERMAPTRQAALARVVAWRRAGGFAVCHGGGATGEIRWTERGLRVGELLHGVVVREDLWHRNRLVERASLRDEPWRVSWPVPDRTGVEHEALRRGAWLRHVDDHVTEASFNRYVIEGPLPDDWPTRVEDLPWLRRIDLRTTRPRIEDLLRVMRALPALELVELDDDALPPAERALLDSARCPRPDTSA